MGSEEIVTNSDAIGAVPGSNPQNVPTIYYIIAEILNIFPTLLYILNDSIQIEFVEHVGMPLILILTKIINHTINH